MRVPGSDVRLYWSSGGSVIARTGAGFGQPICAAGEDPVARARELKFTLATDALAAAKRGDVEGAFFLTLSAVQLTVAAKEAALWRAAA